MLLSCFYLCYASLFLFFFLFWLFVLFAFSKKASDLVSLLSFSPLWFRVQLLDWCVSVHSHTPFSFFNLLVLDVDTTPVCVQIFPREKSHKLSLFERTLNVITPQFVCIFFFFGSSAHFFFLSVKRKTGACKRRFLRAEEEDAPSLFSNLFLPFSFGIFYEPNFRFHFFFFNILSTQKLSPFPLQLGLKYWPLKTIQN